MSDIMFNNLAYCKMILHAVKYPHCAVNGVLLSQGSLAKSKDILFVDAVPLFHVAPNLSPMSEIALMQIDELASQNGLVISGYYTALENLQDTSIEKAHNRISDKLATTFGSPYLVVIENNNLGVRMDNVGLKVAQFVDGSYKACDKQRVCFDEDSVLDTCTNLLERETYKCLADFDNHLDDIKLDFMNSELNAKIERAIPGNDDD